MFLVFKELWPFIREIFLYNDELKKDVRQPKFLLKFGGVLVVVTMILYGFFIAFNEIIGQTYTRNQQLQAELVVWENTYRTLSADRHELDDKYHQIGLDIYQLKTVNVDLVKKVTHLKEASVVISNELLKCRNKAPPPRKPAIIKQVPVIKEYNFDHLLHLSEGN